MKKAICVMIFMATVLCNRLGAQDSTLFPKGEIGKNTDNYTGTIWLSELNQPDSNFTFSLAQAVYAPNAKLDWHIHPGGNTCLSQKAPVITRRKESLDRLYIKAIL